MTHGGLTRELQTHPEYVPSFYGLPAVGAP
jgi:hypothetical protein